MTLHVLVIPSWYARVNGDTRGSFFRDQALAVAEAGLNVGVIYPAIQYTKKIRHLRGRFLPLEFVDDNGVKLIRQRVYRCYRGASRKHARRVRRYGLALFEQYRARYGHPDVVHVQSALYAGEIALAIKRQYGTPYVLTEHSTAFARGRISTAKQQLSERAVYSAEALLCVSSALKELLDGFFSRANWSVLPNVLDRRFIDQGIRKRPEQGMFHFLTVSYFSPKKALDQLISAFSAVVTAYPQARLTLGGDGALRPELEAQAERLGVREHIHFTGLLSRDEVVYEMQNCDCFVLTSRYETFGVVLIEALALGKPVIATRSGGPEDIVNSSNGHLIPVDDASALASAMQSILAEPNRFSAAELRQACLERYGPEPIAQELIGVYQSALRNPSVLDQAPG